MKHQHIFARIRGKETYRCLNKNCFAIFKQETIKGKKSLCTKCEEEIIMEGENLRLANPRCIYCRGDKEAKRARDIRKAGLLVMDDILAPPTEEGVE